MSVVAGGFEPVSSQTKDYKIGNLHAALRRKNKDWLAWIQENVSEWSEMSICGRCESN